MSKKNAYWNKLASGYSRQFGKCCQSARWWKRFDRRMQRAHRIRVRQWHGWHGHAWERGNFGENPF